MQPLRLARARMEYSGSSRLVYAHWRLACAALGMNLQTSIPPLLNLYQLGIPLEHIFKSPSVHACERYTTTCQIFRAVEIAPTAISFLVAATTTLHVNITEDGGILGATLTRFHETVVEPASERRRHRLQVRPAIILIDTLVVLSA